jgi:hypothetical protein
MTMSNKDEQHPVLATQLNNATANDPCAVCGARTAPAYGPELLMAGTNTPVCYGCGRKHAPELADMLWEYRQRWLEADVRPDGLAVDDTLDLPF